MRKIRSHRPSGAMVVAIVALIVALGGTSYAAFGPFKGDKIIKKGSLSGNRLRKNTLSGTQINLAKLGTVPNAKFASSAAAAGSATNATHANNADNADNAVNATKLGGLGPNAFKVGCPSDTTLVAGVCVETAAHAATNWGVAEASCAVAGRRLASISELWAFGRANTTAMTAEEWVDTEYYAVTSMGGSPSFVSMTFRINGGLESGTGAVSASTSHPYRCVTGPSN